MQVDSAIYHAAHAAKDRRFDGVFYIGVLSTGIYCRPICPAKTPKAENCTYHSSAAAAEKAGFRPCLRCRPELAPGNAPSDAVGRIAEVAARWIEEGHFSLEEIASRLNITSRHLRRVIHTVYGVSPIELAQTQRLLQAKRLLTDTRLNISEVALASGFSSLRRFNALFLERYRMNPSQLRKRVPARIPHDTLQVYVGYRPPYDFDAIVNFLGKRAFGGFEAVEDKVYWRAMRTKEGAAWLAVRNCPERHALEVELSPNLARRLPKVLSKVRKTFDVAANPCHIVHSMPTLVRNAGLRLPVAFDPFELAVRAVIGQQVSVAAAGTVSRRLVQRFSEEIEDLPGPLTHLPFTAHALAEANEDEMRALGLNSARARTILGLARATRDGDLNFDVADPAELESQLTGLPGIGRWTAEYVAMRGLGWPDSFPAGDLILQRALGSVSEKVAREIAAAWAPWRSYAVIHLWQAHAEKR